MPPGGGSVSSVDREKRPAKGAATSACLAQKALSVSISFTLCFASLLDLSAVEPHFVFKSDLQDWYWRRPTHYNVYETRIPDISEESPMKKIEEGEGWVCTLMHLCQWLTAKNVVYPSSKRIPPRALLIFLEFYRIILLAIYLNYCLFSLVV